MISAIMPTFNQAQYIDEAIESIINDVDELIIVNDGCTDNTLDVLEKWRWRTDLKVVQMPGNMGIAAALNEGMKHAQGNWLTWVSSDNVYEHGWAQQMVAYGNDSSVGVVYSAYWWGSKGRVHHKPYDPERLINDTNCFFGPSFLIRRDVWKAVGDHRGKIAHDYDHWLRVEEECWRQGLKIVCHPDPLCLYRVHDQRVTVTRRHENDAEHWQKIAVERRADAGISPP